jgi:Protein of unknown function (DUF2924)
LPGNAPSGTPWVTDRSQPQRDWRLPAPGSLLTRRLDDRQIVVKVLEEGFEYESRRYRSLSAIAREVTGTMYVRPFSGGAPSGSGKWQISTGGGRNPIWSRRGRELFYESPDNHIMAAAYSAKADSFAPDKPRPWSNTPIFDPPAGMGNLDLAPDDNRFAVFPRLDATGEQKARFT